MLVGRTGRAACTAEMNGGPEIVDRDRIGVPAAIGPRVWAVGEGDASRRATGRRGTGARRANRPVAAKVAGDGLIVLGGDGVTTDRARPKDAGEGPVHCAGAGDGVVVLGEDRDVTTDRARPKDAGEGPVHNPEAGPGRVSGPAGGEGGTTTPAIMGPEK